MIFIISEFYFNFLAAASPPTPYERRKSVATTSVRIGGASGYWGDSAMATPQFLTEGDLDYIVYDYLAEITMSILARARAKDPNAGYATDFISAVLKPNIAEIARQDVKIISNAGGVNPKACAAAARAVIAEAGLELKVAVVAGDDLMAHKDEIAKAAPAEMFTGADFPDPDKIASINAYLGAFPIARALAMGADIVITGRCVDSAVTLGALIHEFGWKADNWDLLASGSLAGHIIECGAQATGGNFTDWEAAGDIANIGYPIAEVSANGAFTVTKPKGTGGVVNVGTVAEQMLYEIGDPQAYILPDVICDFSDVAITQDGDNRVRVSPARGRPAPDAYKTCLTYQDGWRAGLMVTFIGVGAGKKARAFADAAFARARNIFRQFNAGDFTETSVEVIGEETSEVALKLAVKHPDAMGAGVFLKEVSGLGLATPPGMAVFSGLRPKPSPVVRLFSYTTPKSDVRATVELGDAHVEIEDAPGTLFSNASLQRPPAPGAPDDATVSIPLIKLAWGRSGDKGDKANIGIIARKSEYLPYIWAALDEAAVVDHFAHFIDGGADASKVQRFLLSGTNAVNFLIDAVLSGGGVASIRNDPQGKAYAQMLLMRPIPVSQAIADKLP